MNRVDRLQSTYTKHIRIPWRADASPEERVIFCVYNEADELSLRAKLSEFELETKKAGHAWAAFDFTDTFAHWLSGNKYRETLFSKPDRMMKTSIDGNYGLWLSAQFSSFVEANRADANTVVALMGVASLFGFLKVRDVISTFAPLVKGRLVVFFPGNYENNNYRLLDAYDGWNYLAVPITADTEF